MKRVLLIAALIAPAMIFSGCKKKDVNDLAALVAAVPTSGPREGNNYKVYMKMMQATAPAVGYKVDAWVKGKSEPLTMVTDAYGIVRFESLPFPDAKNHLNAIFHYYRGKDDQSREIDYPYIDSDAYRLKDTQYVPTDATPEPK